MDDGEKVEENEEDKLIEEVANTGGCVTGLKQAD